MLHRFHKEEDYCYVINEQLSMQGDSALHLVSMFSAMLMHFISNSDLTAASSDAI
jgi:hypothetical protein